MACCTLGTIRVEGGAVDFSQLTAQQIADLCQVINDNCGVGPATNTLDYNAGVLTSTVNGVVSSITLAGQAVNDAFGVPLGYLLTA